MGSRLDLNTLLETFTSNVYFQPGSSITMTYPCIVYELSDVKTEHANNSPYNHEKKYQVTVIDRDPDTTIPNEIQNLEKSSFDRFFTTKGLNHYVYTLFF